MKKIILLLCLIVCVFSLCSCGSKGMNVKDIENLKEYVTKDLSEFAKFDLTKMNGTIYVYAAKPCEWFIIKDKEKSYGFIITDSTKILDNKGKKQEHKSFNVCTNDLVEIKIALQFGSINEDYNEIEAWFIAKEIKLVDTLEY